MAPADTTFAGASRKATSMAVFTLLTDGDPHPNDSALTVLLRRLQLARREAGRPTYRAIGTDSGLSAPTICRIFRATKPPAWDNLARVLKALQVADDEISGTWFELWLNAENETTPIPVTVDDGLLTPGRQHCEPCGVWIADPDAHKVLHRRLDQVDVLLHRISQLEQILTGHLPPLTMHTIARAPLDSASATPGGKAR